jgi:hypothetical protein
LTGSLMAAGGAAQLLMHPGLHPSGAASTSTWSGTCHLFMADWVAPCLVKCLAGNPLGRGGLRDFKLRSRMNKVRLERFVGRGLRALGPLLYLQHRGLGAT